MPLIYTAPCARCGYADEASDSGMELQNDDGSLTPLPHPGEAWSLEEAGYTWDQASDEARLVSVRTVLCRRCGKFCQTRSFTDSTSCRTAMMYMLAALLFFTSCIAGVLATTLESVTWRDPTTLFASGLLAGFIAYLLWRRDNSRFRVSLPNRPPLVNVPCCDDTPPDWMLLEDAQHARALPCPQCGIKSLEVECSEIS